MFCKNIPKLFTLFEYPHVPDEWRLFIDSSMSGLKAVLLHNGNKEPTVPVAYSTTMKETYPVMKKVLKRLKYKQYKWKICCDLKVDAILTGLQAGNTSNPCSRCLWNSRARAEHYTRESWPPRKMRSEHEDTSELVEKFLGNVKAPNYVEIVENFLKKYEAIGALMNLKMHFLKCHLHEFEENLGAYSDQHGERFHQDIKTMEKRYRGKNYKNMLGDHCWRLIREDPDTDWSRKTRLNYFNKKNRE